MQASTSMMMGRYTFWSLLLAVLVIPAIALHRNEDQIEIIKLLLKHGADPNIPNNLGFTALHIAALNEKEDVAKILLEYEANPNAQSNEGASPLHFATQLGHMEIVKALVKYGGNIHLEDNFGITPLKHAIESKNLNLIKYFKNLEKESLQI